MSVTSFGGNQSIGENNFEIELPADDSPGEWLDTSGIVSASVQVASLESGGALIIHCSNSPTKPADASDGIEKQTITSAGTDQIVAITAPYSLWKKFEKVKSGSPTATTLYFAGKRSS